ncbi:MAG: lipoyl domain-containing protein [Gemmataceae bacterium]|nr:lipoyl domain-containing protein [Gemmataceae bacterium]
MPTPIRMPDLGGGPARLTVWYADPGDRVLEGERIVEILSERATFEIVAPATGILAERRVFPNDPVEPGQILGLISEDTP